MVAVAKTKMMVSPRACHRTARIEVARLPQTGAERGSGNTGHRVGVGEDHLAGHTIAVELFISLCDIPSASALDYVYGYAVGLDMTRRDLQQWGKDHGRPWDFGKNFDESAPCSELIPAAKIGHPSKGSIWLQVNGKPTMDVPAILRRRPGVVSRQQQPSHLGPGAEHGKEVRRDQAAGGTRRCRR